MSTKGEIKYYIRRDFKPFFDAMVDAMVENYELKGDSWKTLSWPYLMDRMSVQFEDMENRDNEDFYANIGNYCAMIWTNTKNGNYDSSKQTVNDQKHGGSEEK